MAADESKLADERGTGTRSNRKRITPASVLLRFLAFAAALSAFVVMVTDRQTLRRVPVIDPFTGTFIGLGTLKARFNYSDAFIWFVVANGIGFLYALFSILVALVASSARFTRFILLLDLIVAYILLSAASAATAVAYIGNNGIKQTGWNQICNPLHRFCNHVFGAVVASFLAWLFLTLAMIVSFHIRH